MSSKRRTSALAERVAVERRQRAIMAMLRDEQAEQTEQLDDRFRTLRESGLIVPEPAKRAKLLGEADVDDGCASFSYDKMYRDLQLQPTAANSSINVKQDSASLPTKRREVLDFGPALEQFMQQCADQRGPSWEGIARRMDVQLCEQLRPALKKCPIAGPQHMLKQLSKLRDEFWHSKKCRASAPSFLQITFLRLINTLFREKSRFNPIVSSALAFAMELVAEIRIRCVRQCARLIFLCAQLADWIGDDEDSRPRYLPEVMAFLRGALQLCCKNEEQEPFPTMSFPISNPHRQMLYIEEKTIESLPRNEEEGARLSLSRIFQSKAEENGEENSSDDEQAENGGGPVERLLTIRALLDTVGRYARAYGDHPSGAMRPAFCAIFAPFYQLCQRLPLSNYPTELAEQSTQLMQLLVQLIDKNSRVTQLKRSVKKGQRAIKMLEPRFDERFNPERPSTGVGQKNGQQKTREKGWERRVRKERRGALKVLRKDARELAGACAEKQRKVRRERDEKTKRIMQFLEVQESEHKKLKAMKK